MCSAYRSGNSGIWLRIKRFPPVVVRLLARKTVPVGGGFTTFAMSDAEIAKASRLSISRVKSLSWCVSWDDISVSDMRAFTVACGVDFADPIAMRKFTRYLKSKHRFAYLKRDRDWAYYKKLIDVYTEYLSEQRQ